jgi:hypothetical protein
VQFDRELLANPFLQIDATPAHYAVLLEVRTLLDPPGYLGLLLGGQTWRWTITPRLVEQTFQPLRIVAVDPVTQSLAVHGTGFRCGLSDQPSSTNAIASIRRAAFASWMRAATSRNSHADRSERVIATVIAASIPMEATNHITPRRSDSHSSQRFSGLDFLY